MFPAADGAAGVVMTDRGLPHLAERLEFLFDHVPTPDGGRYSNAQAAAALREKGFSATGTYLSQLRSGARTNPAASIVDGLATLFGVQIGYFFDAQIAADTQNELAMMTVMRDNRVRGVMARAVGVSDDDLADALQNALQTIRDEQGDHDDPANRDQQ
jgi:transcriptional regulator with XRE-family HTH domain